MLYDIIGDIHGHADKLEDLLLKLNYKMIDGIYQHQDRKVVFVGDLIDGGTQNRRVIEIVRGMVDLGHAFAVMGNHEYNAICYHTPKSDTEFLRPHIESKNRQHENFLKEYPLGEADTDNVIEWFKTLPLFLKFDHFRVIHACWDQKAIEQIAPYLNLGNSLKNKFYPESATKDTELFNLIERLLKGVEVKLPEPYSFKDKYGQDRDDIRVKWWGDSDTSYQNLSFGYGNIRETFPTDPVPEDANIPFYEVVSKPVFFGHYWMTGEPELQKVNVCCVDYSAGKGGNLVCYSLENPKDDGRLTPENFVW